MATAHLALCVFVLGCTFQPCSSYLRIQDTALVESDTGAPATLTAMNLAAWLNFEYYYYGNLQVDEASIFPFFSIFWNEVAIWDYLVSSMGPSGAGKFFEGLRDNWVVQEDIKKISALGFNSVRVHVAYWLFPPFISSFNAQGLSYSRDAFFYLDQLLTWLEEEDMSLILSISSPGCHTTVVSCFSQGGSKPDVWYDEGFQNQTITLWRLVADRYKDRKTVAAWDLFNEPHAQAYTPRFDLIQDFIERLIPSIREVDPNHMILVQGFSAGKDFALFSSGWLVALDDNTGYGYTIDQSRTCPETPDEYSISIRESFAVDLAPVITQNRLIFVTHFSGQCSLWAAQCFRFFEENTIVGRVYGSYKDMSTLELSDALYANDNPVAFLSLLDTVSGGGTPTEAQWTEGQKDLRTENFRLQEDYECVFEQELLGVEVCKIDKAWYTPIKDNLALALIIIGGILLLCAIAVVTIIIKKRMNRKSRQNDFNFYME